MFNPGNALVLFAVVKFSGFSIVAAGNSIVGSIVGGQRQRQ